jgi:hypothetical protein
MSSMYMSSIERCPLAGQSFFIAAQKFLRAYRLKPVQITPHFQTFRHPCWASKSKIVLVLVVSSFYACCIICICTWIGSKKTCNTRILNKNLEVTRFFEKIITLVHKYKPHEARFCAARFFSGTKNHVSRGLAVLKNRQDIFTYLEYCTYIDKIKIVP